MRSILTCVAALLLLAGCSGTSVLNTITPTRGYTQATNLPFDLPHNLGLDVYTPDQARNAPVVIFLYGGRWTTGSKEDYKWMGEALASRGFVAVLPNYRAYPSVRFPAFVDDAAQAVAWTHKNIGTYGGSPDKVFIMGHSAGAHIAAMISVKEEFMARAGGSRSWLRGMIGLAGPYDFLPITDPELRDIFGPPEKFELSQPILFAEGDNPPLLLLHGEDDEDVWVKNTRNFASVVAKAGGTVETVIYPKMSHRQIVASMAKLFRGRTDVIDHVTEFVTRWSSKPAPDRNAPSEGSFQTTPLPIY